METLLPTQKVHNDQTNKDVVFSSLENYPPSNTVREYITSRDGLPPPFLKYLDQDAYKEALSGLVIKCVDTVIYDPGTAKILIGTRDQEPHPGDWVFGGRKYAGQSDAETAVHNLKRELGITIDPKRIQAVGTQYDMIWDTRAQDSITNEQGEEVTGCQMSSSLTALAMTPTELASLTAAHNEEYSGLSWVDASSILEAAPGVYHPAFVDMVYDTMERVITQPEEPATPQEAEFEALTEAAYQRTRY